MKDYIMDHNAKEESHAGNRQDEIIVFGDIHIYPETYGMMTHLLPKLKDVGYSTVYMEMPSRDDTVEEANIDELLKLFNHKRFVLENFPDGEITLESVIGKKNILSNYYKPQYWKMVDIVEDIKEIFEGAKDRLLWIKSVITFLAKVKELKLRVVRIDVPDVLSKTYGERNIFMVNKIIKGMAKYKSKGIVVTGFQHVIDLFGKDYSNGEYKGVVYDHGILRIFFSEKIKVRNAFLFFASEDKKSELIQKAFRDTQVCASLIIRSIVFSLVCLSKVDDSLLSGLLSLNVDDGSKAEAVVKLNQYFIPVPILHDAIDAAGLDKIRAYLHDVGGKIIAEQAANSNRYFVVELPGSIRENEAKLNALDLRVFKLPLMSNNDLDKIKSDFPNITIEQEEVETQTGKLQIHVIAYPAFETPSKLLTDRLKQILASSRIHNRATENKDKVPEPESLSAEADKKESIQASLIIAVAGHSPSVVVPSAYPSNQVQEKDAKSTSSSLLTNT